MNIGRALTFFTEEERWVEKTTIGTLILLISSLLSVILVGLLGFFIVLGYGVRLMRNVRNEVRPVLPEWDQWGDDLVRGLKLFVVYLVWALPLILLTVPFIFGAALSESRDSAAQAFGAILMVCGGCLSLLYGIFFALIQPGATIAFARREEIRDGLQLTDIWQWTRANLSDVAIVAIVYVVGSMIIGMVASVVGTILCFIGLIVTLPLSQLIIYYFQFHLYGQLDRNTSGPTDTGGYDSTPPAPPAATTPPESPVEPPRPYTREDI
jgi:hypothetical protein